MKQRCTYAIAVCCVFGFYFSLFLAADLKQICCCTRGALFFFFLFCTADGFISNNSEFFFVPCMNLMCAVLIFALPPTYPRALVDSWNLHCWNLCVRVYYLFQIVLGSYVYAYRFSSTAFYETLHNFPPYIYIYILFAVLEIRAAAAATAFFFSLLWFNTQYVYRLRFLCTLATLDILHTVINITQSYGFSIFSLSVCGLLVCGAREMRIIKCKTNIYSVLFFSSHFVTFRCLLRIFFFFFFPFLLSLSSF